MTFVETSDKQGDGMLFSCRVRSSHVRAPSTCSASRPPVPRVKSSHVGARPIDQVDPWVAAPSGCLDWSLWVSHCPGFGGSSTNRKGRPPPHASERYVGLLEQRPPDVQHRRKLTRTKGAKPDVLVDRWFDTANPQGIFWS